MKGIAMRLGLLAVLICSFSIGCAAQQKATGTLPVTVAPATLAVVLTPLPNATLNVAYSAPVSAVGGTPPYTWTATGLPPGLTISSAGIISGTPTTTGTYSVTVTVTDSSAPVAAVKKASLIFAEPSSK